MAAFSQKECDMDMFGESGYHVVRADDTQVHRGRAKREHLTYLKDFT